MISEIKYGQKFVELNKYKLLQELLRQKLGKSPAGSKNRLDKPRYKLDIN